MLVRDFPLILTFFPLWEYSFALSGDWFESSIADK